MVRFFLKLLLLSFLTITTSTTTTIHRLCYRLDSNTTYPYHYFPLLLIQNSYLTTGDASSRMRPQENRWLTKFSTSRKIYIKKIVAGGYHNLTLMSVSTSLSNHYLLLPVLLKHCYDYYCYFYYHHHQQQHNNNCCIFISD